MRRAACLVGLGAGALAFGLAGCGHAADDPATPGATVKTTPQPSVGSTSGPATGGTGTGPVSERVTGTASGGEGAVPHDEPDISGGTTGG